MTEDVSHNHLGRNAENDCSAKLAQNLLPPWPAPISPSFPLSVEPHPFWRNTSMFGKSQTQIRDLAFLGDHDPMLKEIQVHSKVEVYGGISAGHIEVLPDNQTL